MEWSAEQNAAADAELRAAVERRGWSFTPAVGRPTEGDHTPEVGVAIRALDDVDALGLARDFGQVAVFRIDECGCEILDAEVVAFQGDDVVVDLAFLAPTRERYAAATSAWNCLRADPMLKGPEAEAAHASLVAALGGGDVPPWLLALAADAREVRLLPPSLWGLPRDPDRIPRVIALLQQVWQRDPDQRLGQVISNALATRDGIFAVEDERLETALLEKLKRG
ncbi:hypothetical protein DSM112329_04778 [Paraconexibacter sp. AEG42_29]|uniref:Uncharacterized protein n=1 Tax=Paraconexibacter sp. AEG42_29 TaxID=2997339 RepID=A0AAU7B1K1_9ACTN